MMQSKISVVPADEPSLKEATTYAELSQNDNTILGKDFSASPSSSFVMMGNQAPLRQKHDEGLMGLDGGNMTGPPVHHNFVQDEGDNGQIDGEEFVEVNNSLINNSMVGQDVFD